MRTCALELRDWDAFMRAEILLRNCHYRQLENGIHSFVFLSNTRGAVDDYFSILETSPLARGEQIPNMICVLIELRQTGMPPVTYMMLRYKDFVKTHRDRLPQVRIAYLYRPGFVLSLVQSFIDLISERKYAHRRSFPSRNGSRPRHGCWKRRSRKNNSLRTDVNILNKLLYYIRIRNT
jgi:hypothetical protein